MGFLREWQTWVVAFIVCAIVAPAFTPILILLLAAVFILPAMHRRFQAMRISWRISAKERKRRADQLAREREWEKWERENPVMPPPTRQQILTEIKRKHAENVAILRASGMRSDVIAAAVSEEEEVLEWRIARLMKETG